MRSIGDFPRSRSNIRSFESGQLGTCWRHSTRRWKNDEDHADHAALIVNGGALMWHVIAYHAGLRHYIVGVLLGRQ